MSVLRRLLVLCAKITFIRWLHDDMEIFSTLLILCEGNPGPHAVSSHKGSIMQHYSDVIMSVMASQVTGVPIVCPTVCSGGDQRKHQSSASLACLRGIHRWPVDSPHKGPITRKMFPFDDFIMIPDHINVSSQCYGKNCMSVLPRLLVFCAKNTFIRWLHDDLEILSTLFALCEGNPAVTGGLLSQRVNNVDVWKADQQTFDVPVIWDVITLMWRSVMSRSKWQWDFF